MKRCRFLFSCLLTVLLVAMVVLVWPTQVQAEAVLEPETEEQMQVFTEGDYTYTVFQECATITACATTVAGEVSVPEALGGYPVVAIAENAFANCNEITDLTVPDCVQSIGAAAFTGCSKLKSVTLPFVGDSRKGEGEYPQYPFGYIFGPKIFNGAIRSVQYYHSGDLLKPGYYYIPSGLTHVTITDGDIPVGAFDDCTCIETVVLGNGVKKIADSAFDNCKNLTEVTLGNGVESIGYRVFSYCAKLKSITIPASVRSILPGAFNDGPFCSFWVSVDNDTYSSDAFGVLYNKDKTQIVAVPAQLDRITILESVQSTADMSFTYTVEDVYVTDLQAWWNISFSDQNGYPLGERSRLHLLDENGQIITNLELSDSVTDIPEKAFYNCKDMTGITIPRGVKSIGEKAFYGCTGLTELVLPDSVKTIDAYAFSGCTGLTEFVIPDGVQSIEHYTFYDCTGITKMYFGSGVRRVEGYALENCRNLKEVHTADIAAWCQTHFSGKEASPFQFDADLYLNGELVTNLAIPKGVTVIGTMAFWHYTKLTSVTIPKGVKEIADDAFAGCTGLINVVIPEGVKTINDFAFSECTGLVTVSIPSSVKKIGLGAFSDCSSLISAELPSGMTYISRDTFEGCTSLGAVKIPKSVKEVNTSAFKGCDNLKQVYYTGTKDQWDRVYIWGGNQSLKDAKIYYKYTGSIKMPDLDAPVVEISRDDQSGVVTLTWDAISGADCYEIWRSTSKSGKYTKVATAKGNTWEENPAAGKSYYYKLKAVNTANTSMNSKYSNIVSVAVKCAEPALFVNISATGKPVLSWNKTTGAKKYEVYRATSENGKYSKLTTTTKTAYTDSKASAGTQYFYKLRAVASKSTHNSGYTQVLSCWTICARPSVTVKVDTATGKPCLSWGKVSGAVGYRIFRRAAGEEAFVMIAEQTGRTFLDTTALIDTVYEYQVQAAAKQAQADSELTAALSVTASLGKPSVKAVALDTGKPHITWEAIEGAKEYVIYRSTKSTKSYTVIDTVAELSYTDESAAVGKSYYYKVVAVGQNSNSAESSYVKVAGKCAQPTCQIGINQTSGKPVLTWDKITGAKKYEVYRATSLNGKYKKLTTTTKLTYTDAKATVATTYYYKVRAVGSGSSYNSIYSEILNMCAVCAQPSLTVKLDTATGKPGLSWKKITGATGYAIYCSVNGGEYALLSSTTGTSYKDTAAHPGNTYHYKLVALGKTEQLNSAESAEKSVTATCAKPKLTGKIGADGKPELTWNEAEGATGYAVYRSTSKSKGYTQIDIMEGLTYTDTTAKKGKTYYYKVVALCGDTSSAQSAYCKLKPKK